MRTFKSDPTFYPSPQMAMEAPREQLAYVALLSNGENGRTDALGVVDTDPGSPSYGSMVGRVDFPDAGNELHHFGWNPVFVAALPIGGIVKRTGHPAQPGAALNGAPQMVEVSRDGRRVYLTNSLYSPWDAQFYPDGINGWLARVDVGPNGGMQWDDRFLVQFEAGVRPHQVRLEGGDASSDSFCFP